MDNNDPGDQRERDTDPIENDYSSKHGFFYWVGIVFLTLLVGIFLLGGLVFGACFFGL